MSDKVQKIKQEIERRIVQAEEFAERAEGANDDSSKLSWDFVATQNKSLLQFIDSLPKEPKKQPKFKVGDTIKGPCNNIFQVKEVLDKQYLLHSENGDELNSIEIVDKYSCLEEPASEELEEEINDYIKDNFFGSGSIGFFSNRTKQELNSVDVANIARHFAEWQKEKMNLRLQTEYEKGRFDMREEMMKTLVGGEIIKDIHNQLSVKSEPLNDTFGKFGNRVKIIIVKED